MKVVLDCGICGNEFRVDMVHDRRRGDRPEDREICLSGTNDDLWSGLEWEAVCSDCEKSLVDAIKAAVKEREPKGTAA